LRRHFRRAIVSDDLYSTSDPAASSAVLSVSELTGQIKDLLEGRFPSVWVAGEISNFSRPQSGHCYLTLKDEAAQIRAVMWRNAASRVRFDLDDGLEVICRGHLDVYAPRGSYQLVIDEIEPKGLGALERALRKLREKLSVEGLFDPARKRPLPRFPRRIALVTSPTGAAIRDFLEAMARRWRGIEVLVVPVRVQGDGAAGEIAAAIELVNRLADPVDLMVVGRGGGSLEDLWAFNEEILVRAIFASQVPVVSAVGHEIDVTLADLVADVRALTPTDAAQRVVPSREEVAAYLAHQRQRLAHALLRRSTAARARLDALAGCRAFRKPLERIQLQEQRLDDLAARGLRAIGARLDAAGAQLSQRAGRLESLSPLAVLARGYSVTTRQRDGAVVREADQVAVGDHLRTRLREGQLLSRVESVVRSPDKVTSEGSSS
jgi:exodeoxyribonuclease VII large subunit